MSTWKILLDLPDGLSQRKKAQRQEIAQSEYLTELNDGLNNGNMPTPLPNYNQAPVETVIPDQANAKVNAFIVVGKDRPRGLDSGLGGLGGGMVSSIDIIAGLAGPFAKETTSRGTRALIDKSPELDAARIFISQKTFIDDYFHLAEGEVGNGDANSAIAVKADDVRIIARNGIKLVTGTETHLMGTGIPSTVIAGIDLIAGNDDEDLEPLVKGLKLVEALKELSELVQDLNGITFSIVDSLKSMYGTLGTHTHPVLKAVAVPSETVAVESFTQGANLTWLVGDLMQHQKNMVAWEMNSVWPWGDNWFCSPYNNTN